MGVSATNTALERIKESDLTSHKVLHECWEASFGTLTHIAFNTMLNEAGLENSDNEDVKFVVDMIKHNISSQ